MGRQAGPDVEDEGPLPAARGEQPVPSMEWVRALPKAEVHLHLEGCLPYDLVDRAAERARTVAPVPIADGIPEIGSLAALLSYLDWSCALVDEASELERAAYEISARAVASGALHVDVIVSPTHWPAWSSRLQAMIEALDAGFRAAEVDGLATSTLCISLKRTQSRSSALELVDLIVDLAHPRVSALSVDGNEQGGASSNNAALATAFHRAAAAGLRRCAHAGESSGAAGVREAVEILGAERIDHGIRAVEDASVVSMLASRGIPLGVCPRSNVILGVVASLPSHPIVELRQAGVRCSLNTDDPMLYGIDLAGEYAAAASAHGWGTDVLGEIARVAVESSFCDEDRRSVMSDRLDEFLRH